MKKKIAFVLALIMILAVALSACGNAKPSGETVTKDSLIGAYRKKLEESGSAAYKILIDMKIGVSAVGQSQNMEMTGEMDVETTQDAAHISGSVTGNTQGQTQTSKIETYSIKNGDAFDVYTFSDGNWVKQTSPVAVKGDIQAMLALHDPSSMDMTETDTEYLVNGTLSLAEAFDALKNYISGYDQIGEFDLSSLDLKSVDPAKTIYHFDKKTKEPTAVDLDMTDCAKGLMEQLVKSLTGSLMPENTSGIDISSLIKINAEKLVISVKDIVFGKDIRIELPEEAKKASEVPSYDGQATAMKDFYVEELKISLPDTFEEEDVTGYTKAFFDNYSAVLVLREDKADLANYAENMDEYVKLVVSANESRGISEPVYVNGRPTFEYDATANDITYRYYTTLYESDEAFWIVQFASMKQAYDVFRNLYVQFSDNVVFAH